MQKGFKLPNHIINQQTSNFYWISNKNGIKNKTLEKNV